MHPALKEGRPCQANGAWVLSLEMADMEGVNVRWQDNNVPFRRQPAAQPGGHKILLPSLDVFPLRLAQPRNVDQVTVLLGVSKN